MTSVVTRRTCLPSKNSHNNCHSPGRNNNMSLDTSHSSVHMNDKNINENTTSLSNMSTNMFEQPSTCAHRVLTSTLKSKKLFSNSKQCICIKYLRINHR